MKGLRKFGFSFGLALNILGCIMFFRGRPHFVWFTGIGVLVLILTFLYPKALTRLKRILDFIVLLVGQALNVIFSLLTFYLIFTPIAILLKVFKRDLLHQKIDKTTISYWAKRRDDLFSMKSYERMG